MKFIFHIPLNPTYVQKSLPVAEIDSSIDMLLRWSKEMDRLRGCIHACYTDATPTGLRCGSGFAIGYIDAAPTGLKTIS